jgi:hypothetical protein
MAIFIATFAVLLIVVLAMAVGVLMGRPSIQGSCGGLNQVGLGGSCSGACSLQEREECKKRKAEQS